MEYRKDYEENLKKLDKEDVLLKSQTALEHIAPEYFLSDKIDYRVNDSEKISNRLSYTRYVNDIVFYDRILITCIPTPAICYSTIVTKAESAIHTNYCVIE